MVDLILIVLIVSVLSLVVSFLLARWVLSKDTGNKEMLEISDAIKEGANAFMKRQYVSIATLSIILALIMLGTYYFLGAFSLGIKTSVAFLFGAFCSGLAGIIGMWLSIKVNIKIAAEARKSM